jgi:ribonucleoside-diphosphate reductase alpha chain
MLAYEMGCKGLTIYRDGSREVQVLTRGAKKTEAAPAPEPSARMPRPRPTVVHGITQKIQTGCGGLFVTINEDDFGLFEVFANMGKGGGCAASQTEATGRLISTALRAGVDVESIIEQLRGIRCPKPSFQEGTVVFSCSDAIAKALDRYVRNGDMENGKRKARQIAETTLAKSTEGNRPDCPDCGSVLQLIEGCAVCAVCGYSQCG